ncbi:hypothetical protein Mapa_015528 [Marchantia paleacea]|nr:hypothetical protein Mapa_015528 [Marchantia paleacea]
MGHGSIRTGYNKNSTVHLRSSSDHVLHVISVSRVVDVSVVTGRNLVLDSGSVDALELYFHATGRAASEKLS